MRITLIDLAGFGTLRGFRAILTPGVNLFTGDNEAGKSTLQQAILALLYGFYHRPHVVQAERAMHERFRPWTDSAYAGTIEYTLDSGRRFRIQRSFETDEIPTSVTDLTTGRELVPELGLGRHGNVPVGMAHLGMRREVFLNTCFLSLASVASIDAADAVSEAVVSMADTATADSSAEQAVRRLDDAISQVGTSRARSKPLAVARERFLSAKAELEKLEADQLLVQKTAAEKDECEDCLRRLQLEQLLNSYHLVSKKLQELDEKLSAVQDIDGTIYDLERQAEALGDFAGFPKEVRDTVLAQKGRLDTLLEQKTPLEDEWEAGAWELEGLRRELVECRHRIETMEFARGFALEREDEFNRLRFSLEHSLGQLAGERREEEKAGLRQERGLRRDSLRKPGLVLGLSMAVILGAWLAIAGSASAGLILIGLGVALGTVTFYLRYRSGSGGGISPGESRRVREIEGARAAELEERLNALFSEVGIRADSATSGIVAFQRRADAARDLANREHECATLQERLKRLLGAKQRLDDFGGQVSEAENVLKGTLRRAGITGPDIRENIVLFGERCEKSVSFDGVQKAILSYRERRKAILGSRTHAMLVAQRDSLKERESGILVPSPELSGATTERELVDLEGEASRLSQELAEVQQKRSSLEAVVETVLSKHRPRAAIEEDLARFGEDASRLTRFASALALAKDKLKEASEEVHRDFAPRLAQSLGNNLRHITHGRYDSAFVDPKDFSIRLQSPDSGKIVEAGQLSTGTREQAYLLLRIELARMLSSSRESLPLIMDDPFVNFDEKRLRKALELLVEVSQEHQMLLFTKDAYAAEWLGANCKDPASFALHRLPAPR